MPDGAIGPEGRTVRCAKCRHSWFEQPGAVPAPEQSPDVAGSQMPRPPEPATPEAPQAVMAGASFAASPEGFAQAGVPREFAGQPAAPPPPPPPPPAEEAEPAFVAPVVAAPVAPPVSPEPERVAPAPAAVEEAAPDWEDYDEPAPRKPRLRIVIFALIVVLAVAAAAFAAVRYYGAPVWLPVGQTAFAPPSANLELDFPPDRQDRRTLPNGLQFFAASGTVTNIGKVSEQVPDVQVVLRDAQDRVVYTWQLEPPQRELAPGEAISINEAVTDVPASARVVEIGWKAG